MKAIVLTKTGTTDGFEFQEVPKPEPKKNEVLIKLAYAALNHVDIWVRQGKPAYPVTLPHIMGVDGAGVVEAIGADVEGVGVGDHVVIMPGLSCGTCANCKAGQDNQCDTFEILGTKRSGTYAEFVAVPDDNIVVVPESFSLETAAAFPVAYLTAWHMVMGKARIKKGETLLVVGASAGIAIAAIQIAKTVGATVLAVSSSEDKVSTIKDAGASEVFVQKEGAGFSDWAKEKTGNKGVDVVFEHVGPTTWDESIKSLSKYGRLVTCGATTGPTVTLDLRLLFGRDLTMYGARMGTKKEFQELTQLIFSGKIKPFVGKVFPLAEAKKAHDYMEEKKQVGKILLKI